MKLILGHFIISLFLISWGFAVGQIDIAYSPYTISQPGSYIVVKDITTRRNADCITIETCNVSIDLNGHTLSGPGFASGTAGNGISNINYYNNISISNGAIQNFRGYGIYLTGYNQEVTRLRIDTNGHSGIYCENTGTVRDCNLYNNHSNGIECTGGILIQRCYAYYNYGIGIYAAAGMIRDCVSSYNMSNGISAVGVRVNDNNVYGNTGHGISSDGSFIEQNLVVSNGLNGIYAENGSRIIGNTCNVNSRAGILSGDGSTIENNSLYANSTGLMVTGIHNYSANNKSGQNTVNFNISTTGNTFGSGYNADTSY